MIIAETELVTLGERVCTVCKLGKSRGMTTKVLSLLPYSLIPRIWVCATEPADVALLRRLTRVKRVRVHSSYGCFPQVRGGHTSYVGEIVWAEAHSCCTGKEAFVSTGLCLRLLCVSINSENRGIANALK